MSATAINKLVTRVIAKPGRTIATVSTAVPAFGETFIAIAPVVAIVGAAGYCLSRLVNTAAK